MTLLWQRSLQQHNKWFFPYSSHTLTEWPHKVPRFMPRKPKESEGMKTELSLGWAQSPRKERVTKVRKSSDGLHQTFLGCYFILLLIPHFPCSGLSSRMPTNKPIWAFKQLCSYNCTLVLCSTLRWITPSNWQEMSIKTEHFTFGTLVSWGTDSES